MKDMVRQSFSPVFTEKPLDDLTLMSIVESEQRILQNMRYTWQKYSSGIDNVKKGELCKPDEAAAVASVHGLAEFCTLTSEMDNFVIDGVSYPVSIYRATALKRHLKYLELQGIVKKQALNGNKLLLGCGVVFDEAHVLAYDFDQLQGTELYEQIAQTPNGAPTENVERFRHTRDMYTHKTGRNGTIVGVENNKQLLGVGKIFCERFSVPIDANLDGASSFLETDTRLFDFIGMFRLDPHMIGLASQDQKAFMLKLFDKLSLGGQIVVTIGRGNNEHEFESRKKSIRYLTKIAQQHGLNTFFFKNYEDSNCKAWDNGAYMDLQTLVISK